MECTKKQIIIITFLGFIIGKKGMFDIRESINEIHLLNKFKKSAISLNAKIIILWNAVTIHQRKRKYEQKTIK